MHSTNAFINGTGAGVHSRSDNDLEMLNTLLSGALPDAAKEKEQRQVEKERQSDTISEPGGFKNDPDDPTNPNEVRHRHNEKVDEQRNA
jgi:hypothetical protein